MGPEAGFRGRWVERPDLAPCAPQNLGFEDRDRFGELEQGIGDEGVYDRVLSSGVLGIPPESCGNRKCRNLQALKHFADNGERRITPWARVPSRRSYPWIPLLCKNNVGMTRTEAQLVKKCV